MQENTTLSHTYTRSLASKEQVYLFLLQCLNILTREEKRLTPAQEEIVFHRLITPNNLDCFKGYQRQMLQSKLQLSSPALSMRIKELVEKGWLEVHLVGAKPKYVLPARLQAMKEQLENQPQLTQLNITLVGKIVV